MKAALRRPRTYVAALAVLLPLSAGAFLWQHPAYIAAAQLFNQVVETLSQRYVDSLPMDSLYLRAARGMVKEFRDPYTVVFTPTEAGAFQSYMSGTVTGVGINIASAKGFYIAYVFPGTPAQQGGLRIGDQITHVDTMTVAPTMELAQLSSHIMGVEGTPVRLTVVRYEALHKRPDTLQITMKRAQVHRSVVPYTLLLDNQVGYIPLSQFGEGAASEVRAAVTLLEQQGAKRFVLDLRNNPGGLTNEAVALCGIFLQPGDVVVKMKSRAGEQAFTTPPAPQLTKAPLAVLVNAHTASAAEITSSALQDHDRAVVIGQPTYGKGVGQEIIQLPGQYAMKFTTMRWYTPTGRWVQRAHTLLPTGEYAEPSLDSGETLAQRLARPALKSMGGRVIYGGGGVVPDVAARDVSDLGTQSYLDSALKANVWPMQSLLSSYALSVAPKTPKPVKVTPAMRTAFVHELQANGIVVPSSLLTKRVSVLDRAIAERVALAAGGLGEAKRVTIANDVSLSKAVGILSQSGTQDEAFRRAAQVH